MRRKGWDEEEGVERGERGGARETCSGMDHPLPDVLPGILLPSPVPSPSFQSDFRSEGEIVPIVTLGGSNRRLPQCHNSRDI